MKKSLLFEQQAKVLSMKAEAARLTEQAEALLEQASRINKEAEELEQALGQANPTSDIPVESPQAPQPSAEAEKDAEQLKQKKLKNQRQAANRNLKAQLEGFSAEKNRHTLARLQRAIERCNNLSCNPEALTLAQDAIKAWEDACQKATEEKQRAEQKRRDQRNAERREAKKTAKVKELKDLNAELKNARKAEAELKAQLKQAENAHAGLQSLRAEIAEAESDAQAAKAYYKKNKPTRVKKSKKSDGKSKKDTASSITSTNSSAAKLKMDAAVNKVTELMQQIATLKATDEAFVALNAEIKKAEATTNALARKADSTRLHLKDLSAEKDSIIG